MAYDYKFIRGTAGQSLSSYPAGSPLIKIYLIKSIYIKNSN